MQVRLAKAKYLIFIDIEIDRNIYKYRKSDTWVRSNLHICTCYRTDDIWFLMDKRPERKCSEQSLKMEEEEVQFMMHSELSPCNKMYTGGKADNVICM